MEKVPASEIIKKHKHSMTGSHIAIELKAAGYSIEDAHDALLIEGYIVAISGNMLHVSDESYENSFAVEPGHDPKIHPSVSWELNQQH